jgi:hypothetical protein
MRDRLSNVDNINQRGTSRRGNGSSSDIKKVRAGSETQGSSILGPENKIYALIETGARPSERRVSKMGLGFNGTVQRTGGQNTTMPNCDLTYDGR